MCTHSWIFLDIYRLQSSNCFFILRLVAAASRSARAAEAGLRDQGLAQGGSQSHRSAQPHSQELC